MIFQLAYQKKKIIYFSFIKVLHITKKNELSYPYYLKLLCQGTIYCCTQLLDNRQLHMLGHSKHLPKDQEWFSAAPFALDHDQCYL